MSNDQSNKINEAALWLATTPRDKRGHAVPELKKRFGLNASEAVAAIRQADLIRARAH